MLKFNFIGSGDLQAGIDKLSGYLDFCTSEDGIPVSITKAPAGSDLRIFMKDCKGSIEYAEKAHFFRALSILAEEARCSESFDIVETPQFDRVGACFDICRNSIFTVDSMALMLDRLAMMGVNTTYLYMEDVYVVPEQPYFGYMRGRLSHDELKAMDDHADIFGIEIVPVMQSLAHLSQFLKWDVTRPLQDTGDILLVGSEETYTFIEQMIRAVSAPLRTKRIHVGMDEAHSLGMGNYLNQHGLRPKMDIMLEHLVRVKEIAAKFGLETIIWSDTFMNSIPRSEADGPDGPAIPQDVLDKYPSDVRLVNWDYGTHKADFFARVLRTHQEIDPQTIFAAGVWTWRSIGTNFGASFININESFEACKQVGVREVFVCMWGDDGGECNMFSALLGIQLAAEHAFARNVDTDRLKKRVLTCTGISYDDFMLLNMIDETPGTMPGNPNMNNPGKFLLFQDILMGLFDKHIEGLPMDAHYRKLEKLMKKRRRTSPVTDLDFIFATPEKLVSVLAMKAELGIRLKKAYDENDMDMILQIAGSELPKLSKRVDALRTTHRTEWHRIYKPFGWETLDHRYGGLISRIETVQMRLNDYLDGRIPNLEELEQERLTFHGRKPVEGVKSIGGHTRYARLFSGNATP